ncbi:GAF domain-containing protein [Myxococcota bacterium]|nr:GAF domain-containing protein [Myxococcota bacterium]
MISAEIPPDEQARQEALDRYGVVDNQPEALFDRITRMVALALDVPIALVSLVDRDRQWFLSRYGLNVSETPRSWSFCGHVVASRQPLEVPDTHADERFADNPLVKNLPKIRFYAGSPLRTPDGHVLGTLCAIAPTARRLTDAQRELLNLLATQVVEILEQRRRAMELTHALAQALTGARLAELSDHLLCALDDRGSLRVINAAWERRLGLPTERLRAMNLVDLAHPDDRAALRRALREAYDDPTRKTTAQTRLSLSDGAWLPLVWDIARRGDSLYAAGLAA